MLHEAILGNSRHPPELIEMVGADDVGVGYCDLFQDYLVRRAAGGHHVDHRLGNRLLQLANLFLVVGDVRERMVQLCVKRGLEA